MIAKAGFHWSVSEAFHGNGAGLQEESRLADMPLKLEALGYYASQVPDILADQVSSPKTVEQNHFPHTSPPTPVAGRFRLSLSNNDFLRPP